MAPKLWIQRDATTCHLYRLHSLLECHSRLLQLRKFITMTTNNNIINSNLDYPNKMLHTANRWSITGTQCKVWFQHLSSPKKQETTINCTDSTRWAASYASTLKVHSRPSELPRREIILLLLLMKLSLGISAHMLMSWHLICSSERQHQELTSEIEKKKYSEWVSD